MKITFISWAASCSRSDNIARELGGTSHKIYWGWLGSNPFTIWLKYFGQLISTLRILFAEKPEVVFVMTPPLFAVLAVLPYCFLRRTPFVMDAHTAAFLHPRWKHWQWLQRWLCRKAATTIVTNAHLVQKVEEGGGQATIIKDVPVEYPIEKPYPLNGKFAIATVCSFNYDEPVEEIFKAAERLQNVQFYVTGDIRDLDPNLAGKAPENVQLTGFLPDADYGSLLKSADAVLTLTTRDHTMLRGAYEAIYLGTPVIISDWPILQEAFPQGAFHVNNTAEGIAKGVREMQKHHIEFQAAAKALREKKLGDWQQSKKAILEQIASKIGR